MINYDKIQATSSLSYDSYDAERRALADYALAEIDKRMRILAQKRAEIDRLEYEASLIQSEITSIFKSDSVIDSIRFIPSFCIDGPMPTSAVEYFRKFKDLKRPPKKGTDERAKYDECKAAYDYLIEQMSFKFFKGRDGFTLKDIYFYGWNDGYIFVFDYNSGEDEFSLYIPKIASLTWERIEGRDHEYHVSVPTGAHSSRRIASDIDCSKVADALEKYLNMSLEEREKYKKS